MRLLLLVNRAQLCSTAELAGRRNGQGPEWMIHHGGSLRQYTQTCLYHQLSSILRIIRVKLYLAHSPIGGSVNLSPIFMRRSPSTLETREHIEHTMLPPTNMALRR